VAESAINDAIRADGADLYSSCTPGTLVIADLTDPLLAAAEANGIFQVLTEQYRTLPLRGCGKLLALDEAHKFMDGVASDGLSEAIVAVARLMRHDGMRLAVSTQSPLALAPELLELVTVAVLHRFHSRDWFSYLSKKLPLSEHAALELAMLQPGHALAFASRLLLDTTTGGVDGMDGLGVNVFPLRVRGRITADRGASRRNAAAASV
jgi:DNA phosphorothioation-dependent restriction protein DptH